MEKTGNSDFIVSKQNGKLMLRLPGGDIIEYDLRFGYMELAEGESVSL